MKHLIGYKVFESFRATGIKEDIKDIFDVEVDNSHFEMTDWSHKVGTDYWHFSNGAFAFRIQKQEDKSFPAVGSFQILELKDFILRVLSYGEINPCEIQIYVPLPLGVEYITKRDIIEAQKSKLGFFSDYKTHSLIIKIIAFG
jgi:hypothetical protein